MWFAIAAALSVLSGISQFGAARAAGQAAKDAGKYQNILAKRQAAALDIKASEAAASKQREAMLERRAGRLAQSRAVARAAASGAGVSDPTVENILGDIEGITNFRALSRLYEGRTAETGLQYEADLARAQGQNLRWSGRVQERLMNAQANQALLSSFASGAGLLAQGGYFDTASEGISQTPPVPRPKPTPPTSLVSGASGFFEKYGGRRSSYYGGYVPGGFGYR